MGALGFGEGGWQQDLTVWELGVPVSLPGSPTAIAARGTVSALKSHLIFTLTCGCCGAVKVMCLLSSEGQGKRPPCSGLRSCHLLPVTFLWYKGKATWQLPLLTLNFVLFPELGSTASKNVIDRTCISCFRSAII